MWLEKGASSAQDRPECVDRRDLALRRARWHHRRAGGGPSMGGAEVAGGPTHVLAHGSRHALARLAHPVRDAAPDVPGSAAPGTSGALWILSAAAALIGAIATEARVRSAESGRQLQPISLWGLGVLAFVPAWVLALTGHALG